MMPRNRQRNQAGQNRGGRRKVLMEFQMTYHKRKFCGSFEEDWGSHARDFVEMEDDYETHTNVLVYLLHFILQAVAGQYYDHLKTKNMGWIQMLIAFDDRLFSQEKQEEI